MNENIEIKDHATPELGKEENAVVDDKQPKLLPAKAISEVKRAERIYYLDSAKILGGFSSLGRLSAGFLRFFKYKSYKDYADYLLKIKPSQAQTNPQSAFNRISLRILETSTLEIDQNVTNPFLSVYVVDIKTGALLSCKMCPGHPFEYLQQNFPLLKDYCSSTFKYTTSPVNFADLRTSKAIWNENFTIDVADNESIDSNTLILFEIHNIIKRWTKEKTKKEELAKLAWGYLRPIGLSQINSGALSVQLYRHKFTSSGASHENIFPQVPNVFYDFLFFDKETYNNAYLMIKLDLHHSDRTDEAEQENKQETYQSLDSKQEIEPAAETKRKTKEEIEREEFLKSIEYRPEEGSKIPRKFLTKITTSFYGCSALKFSPNGRFLAGAVVDRNNFTVIKIYDMSTQNEHCNLFYHNNIVHEINWHSGSKILTTCSSDHSVRIFKIPKYASPAKSDIQAMAKYMLLEIKHDSFVYCTQFLQVDEADGGLTGVKKPTSLFLASGSRDGQLKVWKANLSTKTYEILYEVNLSDSNHDCFVNSICSAGKKLYTGDSIGRVTIYQIEQHFNVFILKEIKSIVHEEMESDLINCIKVIEESGHIMVQNRDNCLRLIEESTGNIIVRYFRGHFSEFNVKFFLSTDHQYIATGNENGQVRIWDLVSGNMLECDFEYRINGVVYAGDWSPVYNVMAISGFGSEFPIAIFYAE